MIFLRVLPKKFLLPHYSGAPGARGPRFIEPPEPRFLRHWAYGTRPYRRQLPCSLSVQQTIDIHGPTVSRWLTRHTLTEPLVSTKRVNLRPNDSTAGLNSLVKFLTDRPPTPSQSEFRSARKLPFRYLSRHGNVLRPRFVQQMLFSRFGDVTSG